MRYELIRLAQLVFALTLMFSAFLGGIGVGWWRWGRDSKPGTTRAPVDPGRQAQAPAGLFTSHGRDDEVVLNSHLFDTDSNDAVHPQRDSMPIFAAATTPEIGSGGEDRRRK